MAIELTSSAPVFYYQARVGHLGKPFQMLKFRPTPLSKREVEKILAVKKEEVKPTYRLGFEEGDVVRIISGPFADFNGTISEINVDQSKLKVLVNIFDRETPVELGFDQVAKV